MKDFEYHRKDVWGGTDVKVASLTPQENGSTLATGVSWITTYPFFSLSASAKEITYSPAK